MYIIYTVGNIFGIAIKKKPITGGRGSSECKYTYVYALGLNYTL